MNKISRDVIIGLLFLICRSAAAEDRVSITRSFSLVLRGGFGLIAVGDFNTTLGSINSMYDFARENYPDLCSGKVHKLPDSSFDEEVEFQWATGRLGVGIAVSAPTHYDRNSDLTYILVGSAGTQTNDYTYKPEIHASAPIVFNLYYSHPLSQKLDLLFHGGIGHYHARMTYDYQWHILTINGSAFVGDRLINVSGNNIGFHIGLGLEYRLDHRFSMILESQWRFVKIRNLKGNMLIASNGYDAEGNLIGNSSSLMEGSLYHLIEEDPYTGLRSEQLYVFKQPPDIGIGFPTDIRKAYIDLGGLSFTIGLKIGLF